MIPFVNIACLIHTIQQFSVKYDYRLNKSYSKKHNCKLNKFLFSFCGYFKKSTLFMHRAQKASPPTSVEELLIQILSDIIYIKREKTVFLKGK